MEPKEESVVACSRFIFAENLLFLWPPLPPPPLQGYAASNLTGSALAGKLMHPCMHAVLGSVGVDCVCKWLTGREDGGDSVTRPG